MSCEDEDMFKKLLAAGVRGFYRPDLIIHHYVAPERVSKRYFRSWCFWRGVSLGILDHQQPEDVVYVLGVPRHMIGTAVRSTLDTVTRFFGPGARARRFANELPWWDLAGFVYGKHWQRPAAAANRTEPVASISKGAPWTQA
jgi:hypothetical protein